MSVSKRLNGSVPLHFVKNSQKQKHIFKETTAPKKAHNTTRHTKVNGVDLDCLD